MHLTSDKRIWIPDDDDWVNWSGDYEQDQFNEVMPHVSNRDVALDIGAHVGIWSMRLAQNFKRVIAFEPVPKHIECWKRNMSNFISEQSEWGNISTLETVALGHENGTATMKVPILPILEWRHLYTKYLIKGQGPDGFSLGGKIFQTYKLKQEH